MRKTLDQLNPINYCKLHNLPGPNWQYHPMPGCYNTQRCHYCNDRADTADPIPNPARNNPFSKLNLHEFWLVDCCDSCKHALQTCQDNAPRKRAYHLLLTLRLRQQHAKGPRSGPMRSKLDWRIVNLTARVKNKPFPLF